MAALQKPTQHSASSWHIAPAAVQATARHRPALHEPSQQSFAPPQLAPVAPHAASRHSEPAQVEPAQQSNGWVHPCPGLAQLPSTQRPPRQLFEQHTDPVRQASPMAAQPHVPSARHCPSQQSLWKLQVSPPGLQGSRHRLPTHEPWQQSAFVPQLARSFTQVGGGASTVGPQAVTKSTRRKARGSKSPPYFKDRVAYPSGPAGGASWGPAS